MKFAIVGAGNTGHAISAYLADKNAGCVLYTRSEAKAAVIQENGITATGGLNGTYPVRATARLDEAVNGADCIIVTTQANAHRTVAEQLKPLLTEGQAVVIFNSNWGAMEFVQVLGDDIRSKNLVVAETSAQLFVASSPKPGQVNMSIKAKVGVAASDPAQTRPLIDRLSGFFPQFQPVDSIIETTMATTNPVIHVPITVFNLARIENAQPFTFYGEGASRAAVDLIVRIDKERIAVAKAIGCEIDDVLTGINSFWPQKHDNLFDALTKNETYLRAVGPKTLNHRYLTEDVPFGIAPIAQIGRLFGVETPYTDALLSYLDHALPAELIASTLTFRKEDFC